MLHKIWDLDMNSCAFLQLVSDRRVSGFVSALYLITSFSVLPSSPSFIKSQLPFSAVVDGIANGALCSELTDDAHTALSPSAAAPLTHAALPIALLFF
jgi:hypothetical protein